MDPRIIRTETETEVLFDFRPLGTAQGEAIVEYLRNRVGALEMGVDTGGLRVVVLLHDLTVDIPKGAEHWHTLLGSAGVDVEIRLV